MMKTLKRLFARRSHKTLQPRPRRIRCLTPIVQQNADNPDFYFELGTSGADGRIKIERIFPHNGKTEVYFSEPESRSAGDPNA